MFVISSLDVSVGPGPGGRWSTVCNNTSSLSDKHTGPSTLKNTTHPFSKGCFKVHLSIPDYGAKANKNHQKLTGPYVNLYFTPIGFN